jgi:ABC-2 type transport system permease protein
VNKTLLVLRHELATTFRRRSFLILSFGLPLLAIIVVAVLTFLRSDADTSSGPSSAPAPPEIEVEGYVDQSGLIRTIPETIPPGHLLSYAGEEQAKQALSSGEISAYYVIPADYLETGELFYVYPDTKPLLSSGQEWVMRRTLLENLVGDAELADMVWNPINLEWTRLASGQPGGTGQPGTGEENDVVQFIPALMVILLYVSFMMNANLLAESVSGEKENRTMEILMVSISPRQMLTGKIVALGTAGLVQVILWVGTAFALINMGGQTLALPQGFTIPASILFWGVVFYLLGYAVYGGLMAGVGALTSRMKDASSASFLILSPLMVGYMIGLLAPLAEETQGLLPVVLSFFPLTAPVLMMMRLADGTVPLWQILLSAALMLGTAYLVVRAVAAMFHAQNLLSGQSFSAKRFFRVLLGRAS